MANECNDISEIVKKCKILLLDIEGTTTSISFVKDKLFPYAEANVKEFLESQWENQDVKDAVSALRKLALEDEEQKVEGVVSIPGEDAGKEEQIEGLVKSVKWQMSADRKAGPLKQLQGLIWKQGYDKGDIKGHVYDDVAPALALWNATEGQKVYIYSSGSVQAQKLLFNQSAAGDLLPQIEGHFDTAVGAKQDAASYTAIAEKIGCKPDEILFLTDVVKEAQAAREAGVHAALVSREGNAPLPADAAFPVLHSFDQLALTNKRKPEPQEEQVPAKVAKTDIEASVKTAIETNDSETVTEAAETDAALPADKEVSTETVEPSEIVTEIPTNDESEKMEVEEEVPVVETPTVEEKVQEAPVRVETVIEEVTASPEVDAPVCDIDPVVIEESVEKTDKNDTEMMETESTETEKPAHKEKAEDLEKANEEKAADVPVAEETAPAVEIEDVTNDQEVIAEGIELVEDLVPVVEEPAVEMEDLNNVADVLNKECDEILLKVHDVTNLDSIPVKPLLNSIAEEDIDAGDTNDIVDSILDTEIELGVKPSDEIDINIAQDISDAKVAVDEVNAVMVDEIISGVTDKAEASTNGDVANESPEAEKITETPSEATATDTDAPTQVTNGEKEVPENVESTESKVDNTVKVTETEETAMVTEEQTKVVNAKVNETEIASSADNKLDTADTQVETKETIEEQLDTMEAETEVTKNETQVTDSSQTNIKDTEKSDGKMESESEINESVAEPAKDLETKIDTKECTNSVHVETEVSEKLNGKLNGDTEVKQNGDVSKDEELSARLSVENGKEMNGANGNGDAEVEMESGDKVDIPDIKVKSVSDETHTEPIEQPVEA